MPATPTYGAYEFLNAAAMNAAFGAASGAVAQAVSAIVLPGLVRPDVLAYAYAGLTVSVSAAAPFQLVNGSGVAAYANGLVSGQSSSTYSVSFSGLVPASGAAVTAYLAAQAATIGQVPIQVTGPPPGHPDYNPTFVPYTLYTQSVDTVSLFSTTGVPDSVSTFEVARATLASGATGFALDPTYQQRATAPVQWPVAQVSGSVSLTIASYAGRTAYFTASGTPTLPSAAQSDGLTFGIVAGSGTVTPTASGTDLIYGVTGTGGSPSVTVQTGAAVFLSAVLGRWQVVGFSLNSAPLAPVLHAVTGASFLFNASGTPAGSTLWRSNGSAAMTDTLPSGVFTNGWSQTVTNVDPVAPLVISASGCSLDGVAGGSVILLTRWSTTLWTDGTNFWANSDPLTQQTSYNIGAQQGLVF